MAFIVKNNLNPEVFSWFGTSKAICNVGNGIVGVDLTGDVYPCHGCFYDNTNEFKIGTLDDFENGKLDEVRKKFEKLNKELPMDCMSCSVNFCMKCQAANLAKSNKDTFEEKWNDYQGNWQVCQTFKFNDKYNKSLRYMLQNKG
jgi:radical SAM protein with 4Fe4S-binding SPASM domain